MKRLLFIALVLSACETTKYVTNSNFYTLQKGMTEQAFLDWVKPNYVAVNGRPATVKMFNHNGEEWKVYVFIMYNVSGSYASVSHSEYVAFVGGVLREYGNGSFPITIQQNPNSYNLSIQNR